MNSSRLSVHFRMNMFVSVAAHAVVLAILGLTVDRAMADVFTWSPQCPSPTWFGVCEGEICDVGNSTPLSLNNWGRSGCGDVAFPGVGDDVVIDDGMVSLVDTAVGMVSIGANGVVDQPIGTMFEFTAFTNGGELTLRDNLTILPSPGDYPDIFNSGLIRCIGDVAIGDLTHSGHIDVEQGSLALTGNLDVNGGTMQVAAGTTASFFGTTRFTGDLVAEVAGAFQFQDPNSTLTTAMTVLAPGGTFDFRGNGLEMTGGVIQVQPGSTLVNKATSTMHNTEDGGGLLGPFINEGLFIDDSFRNSPALRSDFDNRGEYRIVQGTIDGDITRNSGQMRKVSPSTVMFDSELDLQAGELRVEEGSLVVTGGVAATNASTVNVSPGASLEVRPNSLAGQLNVGNDGSFSVLGVSVTVPPEGFTMNASGNGAVVGVSFFGGQPPNEGIANGVGSTWVKDGTSPTSMSLVNFLNAGTFNHNGGNVLFTPFSNPGEFRNTGVYNMHATASNLTLSDMNNEGVFTKLGDLNGSMFRLINSGLANIDEGPFEVTQGLFGTAAGFIDVKPGASVFVGDANPSTGGIVKVGGVINGFVATGGQFLLPLGHPVQSDAGGVEFNVGGEGVRWESIAGSSIFSSLGPLTNGPDGRITFSIDAHGAFPPTATFMVPIRNHGIMTNEDRLVYNVATAGLLENTGEFILSGDRSSCTGIGATTRVFNSGRFICRTTGDSLVGLLRNTGRFVVETGNPVVFRSQLVGGQFEVAEGAEVTFVESHPAEQSLDLEVVGGTLGGGGTINGAIVNDNGVITPGSPIGELTVNGYLGNMPGTTAGFEIELAGPPESGNFDRVTVNGEFGFIAGGGLQDWGALRVVIRDGFVPQPGMTYEILNVSLSSAEGRFDNVVLVNFPPGLTIEQSSTLNTHSITIVAGDGQQLLGDMNCDRRVDTDDITGFVTALIDRDAYAFEIPICDAGRADMNADDALNGADIPAFIEALVP